jgi:hypothetical protein
MKVYESRYAKLAGSDFTEVKRRAEAVYAQYVARTKRQPYIRSKYFQGDKVFLKYFWIHLWTKNWRDRMRRLKYLPAALDLIKNGNFEPSSKEHRDAQGAFLHRFYGLTKDKELFYIHIKEDKKTHRKDLVSVFPSAK